MNRSRLLAALATGALAAGGVIAAAGPAAADYGKGEFREIELSANASGPQGGGVWLWIGLNGDGTGDYSGADCGHGGAGAISDKGDVWWSTDGTTIVIHDVVLAGLGFDATVTVPWKTGHYTGTIGSFITLPSFIPPFVGTSQLQVAP